MESVTRTTPRRIPTENELREVFGHVVGAWAKLVAQDVNLLYQTPEGGAIERKVVLSGPGRFHLVLRIPFEFGLIMGRLFASGADVKVDPEDAFAELVNIYCGHLKRSVWGEDVPYNTHLPEKSGIQDWPKGDPDVSCFLRVGAFPVEILLWDMSPGN